MFKEISNHAPVWHVFVKEWCSPFLPPQTRNTSLHVPVHDVPGSHFLAFVSLGERLFIISGEWFRPKVLGLKAFARYLLCVHAGTGTGPRRRPQHRPFIQAVSSALPLTLTLLFSLEAVHWLHFIYTGAFASIMGTCHHHHHRRAAPTGRAARAIVPWSCCLLASLLSRACFCAAAAAASSSTAVDAVDHAHAARPVRCRTNFFCEGAICCYRRYDLLPLLRCHRCCRQLEADQASAGRTEI